MMKNIFWKGYTNDDRSAAINNIQGIVSTYGDVIDSKLFSDLSLSLTIEIVEARIDDLYAALHHYIHMDEDVHLASTSPKNRTVFLNISFSTGSGNLKIETPSVPG